VLGSHDDRFLRLATIAHWTVAEIPQADIESVVVGYGHAAEDDVQT
jgi:hypothetical protein